MSSLGLTQRITDSNGSLNRATSQNPTPTNSGFQKGRTEEYSLRSPRNKAVQYFQAALVILCLLTSAVCLHVQQWLGVPLYWCNRRWYYSWQAVVKESTAILVFATNQWRAPIMAQISSDLSVEGQIRRTPNGKITFSFPDRLVLIANHQIYTDWIFLWWSAYTAGQHGHFFIVLKESLKKIPILGPGMMFFSWIFLSRRWEADRPRFQHRISRLSNPQEHTPTWLLIFPEGTNMCEKTRSISKKWAAKIGLPDLEHTLYPRTRGLQFCLEEMANSVDWMYDCTIAYEGVPPGEYGQDIYSLKTLYLEGRKAPFTHIHWRRFAVKDVPSHNSEDFDQWLYARWAEKDKLLKHFHQHGSFPATDGYFQANIALDNPFEFVQILASTFAVFVFWWIIQLVCRGIKGLPRPG